MNKSVDKAIWIVEDDADDHDLIRHLFKELNWPCSLELFATGEQMLERLESSSAAPFMIITDVNLPKIDGFALREKMLQTPNNKFHSVPFIFWSTHASEAQVRHAFELMAHGFFRKEPTFEQWKITLAKIIDYWISSLLPSKEDKYDKPML